MKMSAGTVTFLFTDIEGSTKLWEQYPQSMLQAQERHRELISSCVEQHGGIFVRSRGEGDSTFSVFPIAADAVAAACDFQRAFAVEPWPMETPIRVRAALHAGTANLLDEDYNSNDVNRCARLRATAHGEQTLLSQTVYDLAHANLPPEITLKYLGRHRLKDLQEPEQVYQLCHPDLRADFPALLSLDNLPTNLPRQLTSFIGRKQEIGSLLALLADGLQVFRSSGVQEKQDSTQADEVQPEAESGDSEPEYLNTRIPEDLNARLVTLTGAGGCGKTRLALQVAAEVLGRYADGVWVVEMAAVSDASLIPQIVASALGLREKPGYTLTQILLEHLRPRHLLLLLDNCEHVLAACAHLAGQILQTCPQVRILATSLEPLNIGGEILWRVPSLSMPDLKNLPEQEKDAAAVLLEYDAVCLFVERAREHRPEFVLSHDNAAVVAGICQRLDGIPLALELAAARIRAMSVQEIEARLEDRFRLLTKGRGDVLPRHQTLRALIDWSYDLLDEKEQLLLDHCSVFADGWTLAAAEFVCTSKDEGGRMKDESQSIHPSAFILHPFDVLDLLTSLVDKSLVIYEEQEGQGRYRLLETIRQYAGERLIDRGESETVQHRHLDYYLTLVEEIAPKLAGPEQAAYLNRLEIEHDNLRAALEWSLNTGKREKGKGEREEGQADSSSLKAQLSSLSLVGELWWFWSVRGYITEGRAHLQAALSQSDAQKPTKERALALRGAGVLAYDQSDYGAASAFYEQSLAIYKELGDRPGMAGLFNSMGNLAVSRGDYSFAQFCYEQALEIVRESGNQNMEATLLSNLGLAIYLQGDIASARQLYEQALAINREIRSRNTEANTLDNLGDMAVMQEDYGTARSLYEQAVAIYRELGNKDGEANALIFLGFVVMEQGEYNEAISLCRQAVRILRDLGAKSNIITAAEVLAFVACRQGQAHRAARLWGAAEALRRQIGRPQPICYRRQYERALALARSTLGEEAFNAAWAEGQTMTFEQAGDYALEDAPII